MVKTVWKFPLAVEDAQWVEMPANAHILCVQTQNEQPCLWALVNPIAPVERRKILIAGTGHEREDLHRFLNYIGTFQIMGGALVFHVFESLFDSALADSEELVAAEVSA